MGPEEADTVELVAQFDRALENDPAFREMPEE